MTDEMEFDAKLTVLDRSTLERYTVCPAQARFVETGAIRAVGRPAIVGQEIHDALAATLRSYIDSSGMMRRNELISDLEINLRQSRPDVQPEVIRSFRSSIFSWASFIEDIHFANILRHDGGNGSRSGQLSHDLPNLGLRLTSELDLLYATASKQVVAEVDYKSGWKYWTADTVRDSFQFQLHAMLVMSNYPEVECVTVRIWNCRSNSLTYPTEFTRKRIHEYDARIQMAVGEWYRAKGVDPNKCDTWPEVSRCQICPARALCPASDDAVADHPETLLKLLIAADARAEAIREKLNLIIDETGEDVRVGATCYGTQKPKANRKPSKTMYTVSMQGGDSDDDG